MYQTTSSTTTPDLSYANGHLSPPSARPTATVAMASESESDLSEAIDLPNAPAPFSNGERYDDGENVQEQGMSNESSHEEDALGSDDPDYDMGTPPAANAGSPGDMRSSSQDSPRQRKRKAGVEPDDYMLNDPELYGLRRSVS